MGSAPEQTLVIEACLGLEGQRLLTASWKYVSLREDYSATTVAQGDALTGDSPRCPRNSHHGHRRHGLRTRASLLIENLGIPWESPVDNGPPLARLVVIETYPDLPIRHWPSAARQA